MNTFYTYILINSIDNQPFYVGKGVGKRMYQHVRDATNPTSKKRSVHCKIVSIINQGGVVLYQVTNWQTEDEAFADEIRLIALFKRKDLFEDGILCNLSDGGEGCRNQSTDSVMARADKHRGMKRSTESKQRMKQAQLEIAKRNREMYGSGSTPETREKQSNTRKGVKWSERARTAVRKQSRSRPVAAYSKDTLELIGEYQSLTKCATALGCDVSTIWKIVTGRSQNKSHHGYIFEYKQ